MDQIPQRTFARKKTAEPLDWSTTMGYSAAAHAIYAQSILEGYTGSIMQAIGYWGPSEYPPTTAKAYECRPRLPCRIFLPESHLTSAEPIPVLFTIHGGGFVRGRPEETDKWNHTMANRCGMVVIGLDYYKAPVSRFPAPIHDIEAVVLAALADPSLPIDQERVAIGGFSAGGNLALATSLLPSMKGKIKAVLPAYPPVDTTMQRDEQARTRRYKPSLGGFRGRTQDWLYPLVPIFDWAYVPRGQALDDPLLSPFHADPKDLPPYIFLIGCELDMLVGEAWRMACKLAGKEAGIGPVGKQAVVKEKLILDDEKYHFEVNKPGSSYKWLLVPDACHGFDHIEQLGVMAKDPKLAADANEKRDLVQKMIGEWLFAGPFKPSAATNSRPRAGSRT